mmetsp:Transcript_16581/g.24786  ORF Transcript_16581/g.24786 Transcript_16581/m.24786 type:complete len:626 (-) Transcript_16581:46-1923(-)
MPEAATARPTPSSSSSSSATKTKDDAIDTDIDEMDLLHDISQEQLKDYKQMLLQLGEYPDKVLINTLSMIAEDYSRSYPKSSLEIYNAIKELLVSHDMKPGCKLPLVYVMDSILKNAKGLYIDIMQDDFISLSQECGNDGDKSNDENKNGDEVNWMNDVFQFLEKDETSKIKLRKVWDTWDQFHIFPTETWKQIGQCFMDEDKKLHNAKLIADAKAKAAGIERAPDGTLQVSKQLRKYMQNVLDDIQSEEVNELDKVSLERLADINPDLLVNIKQAAQELLMKEHNQQPMDGITSTNMRGANALSGMSSPSSSHPNNASAKSIFQELRPPDLVQQCDEWEGLDLNHMEAANEVIKKLLQNVRTGTSNTQIHANNVNIDEQQVTTNLLGAASATANHLSSMLQRLKTQDNNRGMVKFKAGSIKDLVGNLKLFQGSKVIDKTKFTNEGLKEKNDAVIARLYDGGLPFVSSADGRRFSTQVELSKHLDALFRKNQLEKSMERTDDRGWYGSDISWSLVGVAGGGNQSGNEGAADYEMNDAQKSPDSNPVLSSVTADESRDKCVICGINFSMKFNEDEGEWMYENCREVVVLNDDVAEKESENMLVHVTCLSGLGSPDVLTSDQVLTLF